MSNLTWSLAQKQLESMHPDVAAIGVPNDAVNATTQQISRVQLLPHSLKARLPEFLVMYVSNDTQIRPPCGEVTCVFTQCSAAKKLQEMQHPLSSEVKKVDAYLIKMAEAMGGYLCKGGSGKFLFVFQTPNKAVHWSNAVMMGLMEVTL